MVMLDRWGLITGTFLAFVLMLILLPIGWALAGVVSAVVLAAGITRWLGKHLVTSQLPMRAVPQRIKKLVDAPVVVFGHTHDPRWQPLRGGGVYVNSGTWLPATRPGLRRSFTPVTIQPREHALPLVELRQWRDGSSQPFAPPRTSAPRHDLPASALTKRSVDCLSKISAHPVCLRARCDCACIIERPTSSTHLRRSSGKFADVVARG
jgi:hypothetical protein